MLFFNFVLKKDLLAIAIKVAPLTSCSIEEERLSAWVLDDHDGAIVVLKTTRNLGRPPLQHGHVLSLHGLTPR